MTRAFVTWCLTLATIFATGRAGAAEPPKLAPSASAKLTYCPDGKLLAAANGKAIDLWDPATGKVSRTLSGHGVPVASVTVSPDGKLLASGGGEYRQTKCVGEVRLWTLGTGTELHSWDWDPGDANAVAFSPDGERLAAGGQKGIRVWNVRTGKLERELPADLAVMSMVYSPDGKTLAAGVFNERVQLWDTKTWTEKPSLKGHRTEVMAVAYTPDGKTLASTGGIELRLWDAETGEPRRTLKSGTVIRALAFSPDGKTVACGGGDPKDGAPGEVVLWDSATGETLRRWKSRDGGVVAVAFAPDGKTLACRSYGGTVDVRSPANDAPAFTGTRAGDERAVAGVKLCWCPAGKFTMGSPADEPERRPGEDQVEVTLGKGFWIGQYEVTQGQWTKVVGEFPRKQPPGEGADFPVVEVNYAECEAFCKKLTALAHTSGDLPKDWEFRLPTEAQWEYACRAGTKTATSFGDKLGSKQANFGGKPFNGAEAGPSLGKAAKVGSYPANAWGVHDTHGNVFEWCRDWYHAKHPGGTDPDLSDVKGTKNRDGTYSRSRRGGAWSDDGWPCRSAFRVRYEPERTSDHIGFRVVAVKP